MLRIDLGKSLIATKGWASPEAEVAYTRAWQLCQQTRDTSWVFAVLWGLSQVYQVYIVRADLTKHREVGAQFLSLAEQHSDAVLLAVVYDLLSPVYAWFAEGFDTADLQDAKWLLAELS